MKGAFSFKFTWSGVGICYMIQYIDFIKREPQYIVFNGSSIHLKWEKSAVKDQDVQAF